MLWPILECSAVAAGLWIARFFVPVALALPADVASLAIICTMFVWLARRARVHGERRGVTDYRRLRQAAARRILSNDQATPGEHEAGR